MGKYIQVPGNKNKDVQLEAMHNARRISQPNSFEEIPKGIALLCVVVNPMFDAIAYCYDQHAFEEFTDPRDFRIKSWFFMDKDKVEELVSNF